MLLESMSIIFSLGQKDYQLSLWFGPSPSPFDWGSQCHNCPCHNDNLQIVGRLAMKDINNHRPEGLVTKDIQNMALKELIYKLQSYWIRDLKVRTQFFTFGQRVKDYNRHLVEDNLFCHKGQSMYIILTNQMIVSPRGVSHGEA